MDGDDHTPVLTTDSVHGKTARGERRRLEGMLHAGDSPNEITGSLSLNCIEFASEPELDAKAAPQGVTIARFFGKTQTPILRENDLRPGCRTTPVRRSVW